MRRIPKWFYVVLAVVFYVGFHQLTKILQDVQGVGGFGYIAMSWTQYVIPGLLMIAAVFLGKGDGEKQRTVQRVGTSQQQFAANESAAGNSIIRVDPFRRMSEEEFHQLITEFFIRNGFAVDPVPVGLGDGVDLMLRKNGKLFVAQHRHWREMRVGVPMVREQYTVMQVARANGVYVITSGEFTYKAIQYAEDKNISLIDGSKLRRLVNRAVETDKQEPDSERAPLCPLCGAEMLIRNGSEDRFWSCSNYPKCSGRQDFSKA